MFIEIPLQSDRKHITLYDKARKPTLDVAAQISMFVEIAETRAEIESRIMKSRSAPDFKRELLRMEFNVVLHNVGQNTKIKHNAREPDISSRINGYSITAQ